MVVAAALVSTIVAEAIIVLGDWAHVRRVALDAKRARNGYQCVNEPNDCWRADPDEWCASCKDRQRLHDTYRAAATQRAALTRRLVRLAERLSA